VRLASAAVLALLAGCGRPDAPGLRRVESNAGTYAVTIETVPADVPLNAPFDLRITVAARDGSSTADLAVEVDARMPEHFHGMSTAPKVTRAADGSFKAEGLLFHMPGLWELDVDLARGPRAERAQVDITLK
jgi:hypothetical protein